MGRAICRHAVGARQCPKSARPARQACLALRPSIPAPSRAVPPRPNAAREREQPSCRHPGCPALLDPSLTAVHPPNSREAQAQREGEHNQAAGTGNKQQPSHLCRRVC